MMDSKKRAIKKLKAACQIALMFEANEAMAVGTLKLVDALEADGEKAAYDIEDAAFMILKIVADAQNERHAAGESVGDSFWDVFHVVRNMVEKYESPRINKAINNVYGSLEPTPPSIRFIKESKSEPEKSKN